MPTVAERLQNAINQFNSDWKKGHQQEMINWSIEVEKRRTKKYFRKKKKARIFILKNDFRARIFNTKSFEKRISFLQKKQNQGYFSVKGSYNNKRNIKNKLTSKVCEVCGVNTSYCMHHILPLSRGGSNSRRNLIAVCEDCHKKIHPYLK